MKFMRIKILNQIIFGDSLIYSNKKWYIKIIIKILQFILILLYILNNLNVNSNYFISKFLASYKHYIKDCSNLKQYKRTKIRNNIPYVSICLSAYNMKNYIERAILSILNQSFQDFEIIIINDYSNDTTSDIIVNMQLRDDRIRLINHSKNLGVYTSRVDSILASRGKYIILQ